MIQTKNGHSATAAIPDVKKGIQFKGVLIVGGSNADYYITYTMLKRYDPAVSLLHVIDVNSALDVLNSFKPGKDPYLILLDMKSSRQKGGDTDYLEQFRALLPAHHAETKVLLLAANSRFEERKLYPEKFSFKEIIEKPFSVQKLITGLAGFSSSN